MKLNIIPAEGWANYSAQAHLVCFNEIRDPSMDRIDYALVVTDENDLPLVYATIRETDSESAYMQYGGAFPSSKGTPKSLAGYLLMIEHLKSNYKRISTLIENRNTPMLKFAMKAELVIVGLRVIQKSILLEHYWENEPCGT